ncbi:MAG: type II secretion system protein [Phycisphaerae bacterium]|jgi:prepilin-type N-terminal cleavage/methylation domain-containing protein
MRTPTGRRRAGFTLIEVLVVVAIIALLVAILLPSLKAAKEQAKRVDCASNLHQIGLAVMMYANAHKENLPPLYRTSTSFTTYYMRSSPGTINLGLLNNPKYLTADPKVFYCTGQNSFESASLAFNGPDNRWYSEKEWLALSPRPQLRSSYPARLIEIPGGTQIGGTTSMVPMPAGEVTHWKLGRFHKNVIYADFTGVIGYQGGGIETGFVSSPHNKKGFNRLFANGAVRWAFPDLVNRLRPLGPTAPTPVEQVAYYKLLDRIN